MSRKMFLRLFCLLIMVGTMVLSPATTVQAEKIVTHTDGRAPFAFLIYAPCVNDGAGDTFIVTGTMNFHIRRIANPLNPNAFIYILNTNMQNGSAVSDTTGMTYRVTQNTHEQYITPDNLRVLSLRDTMVVVGPGGNNIYRIHYDMRFTINNNGVWVIDRNDYTINCDYVL